VEERKVGSCCHRLSSACLCERERKEKGERERGLLIGGSVKIIHEFLINPDFGFWHRKNIWNDGKISENFMEIDFIDWNNFCYWNIALNSTDFELQLRFFSKFESQRAGYLGTLC
jgi:hypothetical protein